MNFNNQAIIGINIKKFSFLILLFTALSYLNLANASSDTISIIPEPSSLVKHQRHYKLSEQTKVYYSEAAVNEVNYLAEILSPALGYQLVSQVINSEAKEGIFLELTDKVTEKDGYLLNVNAQGVRIQANNTIGLFYGIQTLRQLLPVEIFAKTKQMVSWKVPFVEISDQPRFGWRGMHLDVGRHFMSVDFIKKFIDQLAILKMNRFHWHLTEDQGWRIEIKKYPKLTEVGAWRDETMVGHYNDRPNASWFEQLIPWIFSGNDDSAHEFDGKKYGGYYKQEEIREVVAYAQRRHIEIIPEIEMPGHAQAAITAYPELASSDEFVGVKKGWGISDHIFNPEEKTISFLKDVLVEVMDLFPSKFIHIGGDEAHKTLWENSPRIQQLIKERGLKNEEELQSWFIKQFDGFLTEHGRRLIGWDEILEGGLAENAAVMSWRGDSGGIAAARSGHDVVMADYNYTYFDYYQGDSDKEPLAIGGFLPLEQVYLYNPVPSSLNKQEAKHILGGQGQLWTEYMKTPEHVEYMAFPRAIALSEVLWLNQSEDKRDYQKFLQRLKTHNKRLDLMNVQYRPLDK